MDVTLTDEQAMLRDTARKLADSNAVTSPLAPGEAAAAAERQWAQLLELGLPAFQLPEAADEPAQLGVETVLVVEELAKALLCAPVVGQGVVAPALLQAAGALEALERVCGGDLRVAPCVDLSLSRIGAIGDPLVAIDTAGASYGLALSGDRDRRLVAVELPDADDQPLDLTRRIAAVPAEALSSSDIGVGGPIPDERWARVEALALVAFAADLVGVMDAAVADAVAYAKDRKQFGVAIGSFQAVQHLLASALVDVEGARSCVWYAAWAGDHRGPDEALLAARAAKAFASRVGRDVVEATVQVFGGIAITWEQLSHVRLRRTLFDRQLFGTDDHHHEAIAATLIADDGSF